MKKALVLFFLLALIRVFGAVHVSTQEKWYITVRGSDLNNGVVILNVRKANKAYQLQCKYGASGCMTLKNGNYQMVQLPQNFGMYAGTDVEVYPESAVISDKDRKLGEYCLLVK